MARLIKRGRKKCYIPDDPDKAYLEIRYLYPNEVRKVDAEVNSISFEKAAAEQGITRVGVNPYNRSFKIAEAAITGWGGFFDQLGKPIPFKKTLLHDIAKFSVNTDEGVKDAVEWIESEIMEHNAVIEKSSEAAQENS